MEFWSHLFFSPEAQEEFLRRCTEEGYSGEQLKELMSYLGHYQSNYTGKKVNTFDAVVEHIAKHKEYLAEVARLRGDKSDEVSESRGRGRPRKNEPQSGAYEEAKSEWRQAKEDELRGAKEADEWAAAQWEQIKKMRDDRKAQLRDNVRAKRAVMDAARKV